MPNPNRTIYQAKIAPRLFQLRLRKGIIRINEDSEIEKRCPRCQEYWPADSEFFTVGTSKPDGLDCLCKACKAEIEAKRSTNQHQPKYTIPNW